MSKRLLLELLPYFVLIGVVAGFMLAIMWWCDQMLATIKP